MQVDEKGFVRMISTMIYIVPYRWTGTMLFDGYWLSGC